MQNYEVLSGSDERPVHIRLIDAGIDVWPTTGTLFIKSENRYLKNQRSIEYLGELSGRKIENVKERMVDRIASLETKVRSLTKIIEDLQFTVETLANKN
jgi:hypothetical protein